MSHEAIIGALGFIAFLLWFGLSAAFAWHANGDFFSRIGAAGAAYAVAYFALIRHGEIVPNLLLGQMREMRRAQHLHAENIHESYRNSAFVAVDLGKTRKELGLASTEFCESMKQVLMADAQKVPLDASALDEFFVEPYVVSDAANARVTQTRRRSDATQAVVLVLSTLQWGFGDLLV